MNRRWVAVYTEIEIEEKDESRQDYKDERTVVVIVLLVVGYE